MKKTKKIEKYLQFRLKIRVLKFAQDIGSCKKAYETYGVIKTTFFNWKKKFEDEGENGLLRNKRECETFGNHLSAEVVELIFKTKIRTQTGDLEN